MKNTERKEYFVSTSGETMVTEDGFAYNSSVRVEMNDNTAIIWDTDEPLDISKALFEDVTTLEEFYSVIAEMLNFCRYPDGFFEDIFGIEDFQKIESVKITVDMDYFDEPEGREIIDDHFELGCVGYDFINKSAIGEENDINYMIDRLTEYAENSGFKDYYNRVIKDKSEEEIKKLYREVFGK